MAKVNTTTLTCDRCGHVDIIKQDARKHAPSDDQKAWMRARVIFGGNLNSSAAENYDFCPSCADEFTVWGSEFKTVEFVVQGSDVDD